MFEQTALNNLLDDCVEAVCLSVCPPAFVPNRSVTAGCKQLKFIST